MELLHAPLILLILSAQAHAQVPIKEIAPKVRIVGFSKNGKVRYQFQDGGLILKLVKTEASLEKHRPLIIKALEESHKQDGSWISLYKLDQTSHVK